MLSERHCKRGHFPQPARLPVVSEMNLPSGNRQYLYRRVFALLSEAGIEDDYDRRLAASWILDNWHGTGGSEIDSFTQLPDSDLKVVIIALQGWRIVEDVRTANGSSLARAREIVREADGASERPEPMLDDSMYDEPYEFDQGL